MKISQDQLETLQADAVELIDHGTRSPLLLICEHASNRVPGNWANLGLTETELAGHIGWDIGAAAVTRELARCFGATAVLAGYSRLFIDCNRDPDRPDAIPGASDGVHVPGNDGITSEERELRQAIAFLPLHRQISDLIDRHLAHGIKPVIVSIHSFTPQMDGFHRPWNIGVLWNECDDLGKMLADGLESSNCGAGDIVVGRNQPYSAKEFITYTLENHGRRRGIDNLAIEIRNDFAGNEVDAFRLKETVKRALLQSMPELSLA